ELATPMASTGRHSSSSVGSRATLGWRQNGTTRNRHTPFWRVRLESMFVGKKRWLRGRDLNPRPLGYEPNELPDCSTPRQENRIVSDLRRDVNASSHSNVVDVWTTFASRAARSSALRLSRR